jgi:serine/threonine protein kinase
VKPPIQPLRDGDPKSFQGWEIKGLIGEGGQSTIYLAEKNGQRAALKMIRKEYLHDSKSVDRFAYEIKNLEMLNHPNIARLLEVEDSGRFLAIEFVEGPNLEDYVTKLGPLGFKKWSSLAQSLATTIDYCHSKGIIHKDISPKNIVMGENGPMLIDFGISYLEKDPRLTSDDETIGTPPFMSPEHFGISTPKEMDNFCLGGTLIFAGAGHYPFSGEKKSEWKDSILFNPPNFSGLSDHQIGVLSPLLYKRTEERGSLEAFSKILSELTSSIGESNLVAKEFARVKRESSGKLIQERKKLSVKRQSARKIVLTSAIVSLLSVGLVAFGITVIQNESGSGKTNSSAATEQSVQNQKSGTQKVKTVISIRTKDLNDAANNFYYRKDFTKSLDSATESANLGNAEGMYLAGRAAQALGKFELALTWFQKGSDSNFAQASLAGGIILINQEKNVQAENELRKAIDLGSIEATTALASLYLRIGQVEKASVLFKTSIDQGDMNSTILYANLLRETGKNAESLDYFLQASKAGESFGSLGAGLIYGKDPKTFKEAKKFYQLSIDQGLVEGNFFLGEILSAEGNFIAAKNSYLISADIDGGFSAIGLATLFGEKLRDFNSACIWARRVATLKNVDQSEKDAAKKLSLKYCPKATKAPEATTSKSSSNNVKASESPKASPKPIASSDSFKVSAPLASNVQVDEIFGRAFKNSLMYWVIPLTVIKGAKVPEISAVQFRLIGYPDAGWLDVPYKLKTDPQFGTVQAEVDDILFALIFKDQKYCPEFRFVREESGKVVRIWNKGQPDCATDYNP